MQAKGQIENNRLSQRWVTTRVQHVRYIVDFVRPSQLDQCGRKHMQKTQDDSN